MMCGVTDVYSPPSTSTRDLITFPIVEGQFCAASVSAFERLLDRLRKTNNPTKTAATNAMEHPAAAMATNSPPPAAISGTVTSGGMTPLLYLIPLNDERGLRRISRIVVNRHRHADREALD